MSDARPIEFNRLLVTAKLVFDWYIACQRARMRLSEAQARRPAAEKAEITDDGRLRLFVEIDGGLVVERLYPPSAWELRI